MKKITIFTTIILAFTYTACLSPVNEREGKQALKNTKHQVVRPCTKEYIPVCAEVEVQCIKAPCKPVKQTFANACVLSSNRDAKFLYKGRCEN